MRIRPDRLARAVALLVALVAAPTRAAEGDLDPSFHGDGRFRTEFGLWGDFEIADVHEAPDGRVYSVRFAKPKGQR